MKPQGFTIFKRFASPQERKNETRSLLALALPLLGGQMAQAGNGFVDTVMAGQAGPTALAGVAVGSSLWLPLYLLMLGILMNTTPVTARLLGENKPQEANSTLQQALVLSLFLGALVLVALFSVDPLLSLISVDPQLIPTVKGYLQGIAFGVPAAAIFLVLRCYTEALGHTRPVFWVSVAGLIINIPMNYVLIHGHLGLPRLGGAGCGWATSTSAWVMVGIMLLYIRFHPIYRQFPFRIRPFKLQFPLLARLLKLGLPSGMSIFFEVSIFAVIALIISSLGPIVTAGHQIALNITGLAFMVPLSLALATTIRIGQSRGKKDMRAIRITLQQAFRLCTLTAILSAFLLLATHQWLPLIYSSNAGVTLLASQLLIFAAVYQLSDSWQVMAMGCLRGFEDTTVSMIITLTVYWGLAIPSGYLLGMTHWLVPALGPSGFWIGIIIGLTGAALFLYWRLQVMVKRTDASYAL